MAPQLRASRNRVPPLFLPLDLGFESDHFGFEHAFVSRNFAVLGIESERVLNFHVVLDPLEPEVTADACRPKAPLGTHIEKFAFSSRKHPGGAGMQSLASFEREFHSFRIGEVEIDELTVGVGAFGAG